MIPGGTTPTPERLAAYADGELHGPERAAVEAWLDVSPLARAEVEALRQLTCQCRRTAAPEPSADAWDAALIRLHAELSPGPRPLPLPRPGRRRLVPAIGTAAAAVIAAVALGRALWPAPQVAPPAISVTPALAPATGPLILADARDIDIISMDGDDVANLLVGRPPVYDRLQLASPTDIALVGIESVEGSDPATRLRDGAVMMIVPPAAAEEP
jgi:anti-sigma factor RsiW